MSKLSIVIILVLLFPILAMGQTKPKDPPHTWEYLQQYDPDILITVECPDYTRDIPSITLNHICPYTYKQGDMDYPTMRDIKALVDRIDLQQAEIEALIEQIREMVEKEANVPRVKDK